MIWVGVKAEVALSSSRGILAAMSRLPIWVWVSTLADEYEKGLDHPQPNVCQWEVSCSSKGSLPVLELFEI